jgi:Fic family protein
MDNNRYSQFTSVFHGRNLPEEGYISGYGAIIHFHELKVPLPDRLVIISTKHKKYENEEWLVLTPRHQPENTLADQLTFALKYEGIDLSVLKALFTTISKKEISKLIEKEPTGLYSRKIWFLYEWLTGDKLPLADLTTGNYVDVIDESLQYGGTAEISKRHRIKNNLPGVKEFCPLIRKTIKTETFIALNLAQKIKNTLGTIHPDIMSRTAAFLLLKDSKASYAIEGEQPPQNRAQRWGRAIGQAGQKPLTKDEFIRLQQIVIENTRFIHMGWREQGGFVGEHDRTHGTPLPEHISAKWQDIGSLINGLIATDKKLENDTHYDAVMAAAIIAFGFVFIHPFEDGNGRIHRYLMHHVLARKKYVPNGIIFPVSAIILEQLEEYRKVLEAFSHPRLDLIKWQATDKNNVEVLNDTIDLYRYFDATKQVEYLYSCVRRTAEHTIPAEVKYLERYDQMKTFLENQFEMPDKMVALLVRFLEQGKGKLSERAKTKEFKDLSEKEIEMIENKYQEIFPPPQPEIIVEQSEFPPYKFYKNAKIAKYETWRIDIGEKFKALRLFNIIVSPIETKNVLSLEIIVDDGTEKKLHSFNLSSLYANINSPEYLFFNANGHVDIPLPKGRKWVTMKINLLSDIQEFEARLGCEYK